MKLCPSIVSKHPILGVELLPRNYLHNWRDNCRLILDIAIYREIRSITCTVEPVCCFRIELGNQVPYQGAITKTGADTTLLLQDDLQLTVFSSTEPSVFGHRKARPRHYLQVKEYFSSVRGLVADFIMPIASCEELWTSIVTGARSA
jgi:hypothetical protein